MNQSPIHHISTSALMFGATEIIVPADLLSAFKELVRRGLNTWDQAPPAMKEFGDIITEGEILQDYWTQDSSRKKNKE